MPIFQPFFLLFLLAIVHSSGQTQDLVADDPAQPASHDMPAPTAEESPAGPPPSAEEDSLAQPADAMSLSSPDVLADVPYVYPLLRMRLTPEMRREIR